MGRLTHREAYAQLSESGVVWTRKDANHIYVTTEGCKTPDCQEIERFLLQAGMRVTRQVYRGQTGCTYTFYKHK